MKHRIDLIDVLMVSGALNVGTVSILLLFIVTGAIFGGAGWTVRVSFNVLSEGIIEIVMFAAIAVFGAWSVRFAMRDQRFHRKASDQSTPQAEPITDRSGIR